MAHSMLQVHSVHTSRAMNRSMTSRNHCGVSLAERQHERSRLHAGTLLGHDELAALEVAARLRKSPDPLGGRGWAQCRPEASSSTATGKK